MVNLIDISKGWYYFVTGDADTKVRMHTRLAICDVCPEKEQLTESGKLLIQTVNKAGSTYKCGQCKCPLSPKVAAPDGACPLKKW